MIQATINTEAGAFNVELPQCSTLEDAYKYVDSCLKTKRFVGSGGILSIRCKVYSVLVAFKSLEEQGVAIEPQEGETADDSQLQLAITQLGVYPFIEEVIYLDVRSIIRGAQYVDPSGKQQSVILLTEVGGKPAQDVLSDRGIRGIIAAWQQRFLVPRNRYEVLIPHAPITDIEEAISYVEDYVKESMQPKPTAGPKTAKAFYGLQGELK